MAIFIDADTRVICQGITGSFGALHTKGCLHYGTKLVGGVTPGKGGSADANGLPIYDTVRDAAGATGADATMIFVPPPFAADAVLEAADAGLRVICCITEGVPVRDMVRTRAALDEINQGRPASERQVLIGPNCPGVITPGPKSGSGESASDPYTRSGCKIGIMPGYIHTHASEAESGLAVGIVSRSGTLTYEAVWQTSNAGLGQTTCVGIGGDPVRGVGFIECLERFQADPDTAGVLMIGEIGGTDEEEAAAWAKAHMTKPLAAFIAGRTAPPGRRMGHAGAIIAGGQGDAESKIAALRANGFEIAETPADMGAAMARAMGLG
ncbi:MAG: succinate--CoA ligase subunit alpha [Planctomycetota bacterium]|nr:MAG: succinate--CoA ligase subunit alpha [Planctomycetota bacterium]